MESKKISDEQLLNFLDGVENETERKKILEGISQDPVAQNRLRELELLHRILQTQRGLEQPSKNFTDKVMANLNAPTSFTFISPRNGLILLAGLIVASLLAITLLSAGAFDNWQTLINFNQVPVKTDLLKMPTSVPFDVKLIVKIFVLLNLVLGLILLDRTILRPIFQKRAERFGL